MTTGDKGKLFILFVPLFTLSLLSKILCSLCCEGDPKSWNNGMAESQNGGKSSQNLRDGIAESRNGGKYPQILKDGMMEYHPNF